MSEMLYQARHCTSAQNGNQHQLGGYTLVSYEGKGIAML
jgi:hypothetical protein